MPIPTHGAECSTSSWSTTCRDCGAAIFVLTCSCGSVVLLDGLGHPWPRRTDTCLRPPDRSAQQRESWSASEILRVIDSYSRISGEPVPIGTMALIARLTLEQCGRRVVVMKPGVATAVVGEVVGVNLHVNLFKRFRIPDTRISRSLMSDILDSPQVELVIREAAELGSGSVFEYTFFAPEALYKASGIRRGLKATSDLKTRQISASDGIWVATSLATV